MSKGRYYGFQAQEDAQVINWASVAKGLGDTLTEEAKRREEKKKSIDDASEALGDFIANSPLGGHEGAVASTADLANQAQEMRLMQDRMLKSGELNIKDYNTMRGNLEKDVKTLYQSAKEFQDLYTEDIKRSGPGGSAALQETWMNSKLEGFLNPSKTKYRFNPRTGELMIGTLDDNGNLDQSTLRPVSAIQNDVRTRVDALDVPQAVSNITKQLPGKFRIAINNENIKDIEGFVDNKDFQSAIDNIASSLLVDPSSEASVLTNYLGEYSIEDFTTNPDEKGDDKILMIPNPNNPGSGAMIPDLTVNQKKKAKEAIKEAFLLSIGYRETAQTKTKDSGDDTKTTSTLIPDTMDYIASGFKDLPTDETEAVTVLTDKFSGLGFEFSEADMMDGTTVKVKIGDSSKKFDLNETNAMAQLQGYLESKVSDKDVLQKAAVMYKANKIPKSNSQETTTTTPKVDAFGNPL
jgi:hypothetical protein